MSAAAAALARARANEATAEENRARMPAVTAFVDDMREAFGPVFRVTYYNENGCTRGAPGPDGVVPQVAKRLRPLRI